MVSWECASPKTGHKHEPQETLGDERQSGAAVRGPQHAQPRRGQQDKGLEGDFPWGKRDTQ